MYRVMKIIDQAKLRFYLLRSARGIGDKSTRALLIKVLYTKVSKYMLCSI